MTANLPTSKSNRTRRPLRARIARALSALAVALALGPAVALAEPTPEETKRALELGIEAKALYDQGRWADALQKFSEADTVVHTPVFTLFIARTERRVGKLLSARTHFRALMAEEVAPDSPPPWLAAKESAKTELAQLEPLIPHATVKLEPAQKPGVVVEVDGKPVEVEKSFEIDPGDHVVRVVVNKGVEERFHVAEGSSAAVVIQIPAEGKPVDPPILPPKTRLVYHPGSLFPGAVVAGSGAAGLVVGGILAGLALSAGGDIDEACLTEPGCDETKYREAEELKARAERLGRASTGLFIGGGVVAAAGVLLLVIRPGGSTVEEPVDASWVPEVRVGPTRVEMRLRF